MILVILNLFLLFLVASRYYTRAQAEQNLVRQTIALLEKNEISVDPALLSEKDTLSACSQQRNTDREKEFAAALLGTLTTQGSSGGTHVYGNALGSISFRSNGAFSLDMETDALQTEDYEKFISSVCPSHYRYSSTETLRDTIVVTAIPYVHGVPVYNAGMDFVFRDNTLISAGGAFVAPDAAVLPDSTGPIITKCSAAIHWMDYCKKEGHISNTITAISPGYTLQSTTSVPLLLAPVYKIDTNTYKYYIDAFTGRVHVVR